MGNCYIQRGRNIGYCLVFQMLQKLLRIFKIHTIYTISIINSVSISFEDIFNFGGMIVNNLDNGLVEQVVDPAIKRCL